jgi:hypothetical protein
LEHDHDAGTRGQIVVVESPLPALDSLLLAPALEPRSKGELRRRIFAFFAANQRAPRAGDVGATAEGFLRLQERHALVVDAEGHSSLALARASPRTTSSKVAATAISPTAGGTRSVWLDTEPDSLRPAGLARSRRALFEGDELRLGV